MSAAALSYVLVDVFARQPFAGNMLAVVLGADELSGAQLQAIAREFNLSETTFPVGRTPSDQAVGADYRVRIFTADAEIPFAGHPTLGTAWVLANRGSIAAGERLQACGAGLITVAVPTDLGGSLELRADPRDLSEELSPAQAVACAVSVGLTAADLDGAAFVAGCGLSFVHLPVRPGAVERAHTRREPMSDVDLGGWKPRDPLIGLNVHALRGEVHALRGEIVEGSDPDSGGETVLDVRSRVFVPGPSVPEDPATGSAAVGLGVALVAGGRAAGVGSTRYEIEQGLELGRPSYLSGRVLADGGRASACWVAGQVVMIGEGRIAVPPDRSR